MNEAELQAYLHEQIPATGLLEIAVKSCNKEKVELSAPLAPNINHKHTVFGGSLSVLAITTAWSLVFMRLQGVRNEIVIQQSSMSYLKAAHDEVTVVSSYEQTPQWDRFNRMFDKRGKGRIQVVSRVYCKGEEVAVFEGSYVAFNEGLGNRQ